MLVLSTSGNIKLAGNVYFYTNDTINISADISETNRKDGNVDLFIDDELVPVDEYRNVAPGTHLVYAVDKAGNKSEVKTFYVIADIYQSLHRGLLFSTLILNRPQK